MTLPAVESDNVRGVEGPSYKVGPRCSNPHCSKWADDAHHIVRRSELQKQPQSWVAIDGFVTGNLTGLCADCHRDITGQGGGHKAAIRWMGNGFWWCLLGPELQGKPTYLPVDLIVPQPPTPDQLASRAADSESGSVDACPMCGEVKRRRSTPTRVGRRHRKSWTVLVPDEEQEQGADVLDSLVDNLAPLIPNADSSATGRYYVIVAALAHALMDGESLVASLQGRNAA